VSNAFIAGIDSAIGNHLAGTLRDLHWSVLGSSRREIPLKQDDIFFCDFSSQDSVDLCVDSLCVEKIKVDLLVLSIGVLQPIGVFDGVSFDDWNDGFRINCLNPLRLIHGMLGKSLLSQNAMILTFAGGGINSAPTNYSSYTLSKIALTKSMEILAAEYPNKRFISLGTGWIKSPIHNQTLEADISAGENLAELNRRLLENDFQPVESVSDFVLWAYGQNVQSISGRNFSLAFDDWKNPELVTQLESDNNMFKLRRFGND
jgi:NAD(P)-dependent dehydrogenase (short-subunit alcohol dehydrogenase family)